MIIKRVIQWISDIKSVLNLAKNFDKGLEYWDCFE